MRRSLFAAASILALAASPAFAQEPEETIDDTREEPVDTATANNGAPANLIIGSTGRVQLRNPAAPAVTVNSDNTLTIESGGRVEVLDTDADGNDTDLNGAIGVQMQDGVTGDILHGGTINLGDSYTAAATEGDIDVDGDGVTDAEDPEADGPFARDSNKTGLLIGNLAADGVTAAPGQSGVTGDVIMEATSSTNVAGQDSFGVRTVTQIDGDFLADGRITVRGENSRAISIEAGVTGDVSVARAEVLVPGGDGVAIEGDVGGGVRFVAGLRVTGYRISQRASELLTAQLEDEDIQNAGSAIIIAGSVTDGVFFSRAAGIDFISGGTAVEIAGDAGDTLTIGRTELPDDFLAASGEEDDDDDRELLDHAVINQGTITAAGTIDGKNVLAFLVAGRDDQGDIRAVILEGDGFLNEGSIISTAYDGNAMGVQFGDGAQADTLQNNGVIAARGLIGYDEDGFADDDPDLAGVQGSYGQASAVAVHLSAQSALRRLLNEEGSIIANVQTGVDPTASEAVAIRADSDSLDEIHNTGTIVASLFGTAPEDLADREAPALIAVDARNHGGGLTIRQTQALDENGDATSTTPAIVGDVLFGDGDDTLDLQAGTLDGDVRFGAGVDRLILNGASITGAINDSDGQLTLEVTDGRITLSGEESLRLTEALFNDGGNLDIVIDVDQRPDAFMIASGGITFAAGSELAVSLGTLIDGGEFEVVSAGQLTIDNEATLTATEAPYLYNAQIQRSPTDANTLVLSLTRKTAEELGMNANQAAAYEEAFAALQAAEAVGAAFAGIRSAEDFFNGYNQLLPEYAASAIQFALANNDAASGALSARLRNARLAPDDMAGVWAQEFGYFADRAGGAFGPGYRGQGVGLAIGLDRPIGPFYAVGVTLVGAASEIEEIDGFDEPMVALSGQLGTYAATEIGGFDVSGSLGIGYDHFETERQLLIGDFSSVNTAEWSGWHLAASAVAGRDYTLGSWVVRPEASLTWLTLFESGFEESAEDDANSGLALIVDDRESTSFSAAATMNIIRRFGDDRSWWAPHLRFGYRGEFADATAETTARFGESGSPFTLRSSSIPGSGYLLGFGLSAGSDYSTFTFAYDADVRDGFVRHVGRLVIRLTF
ncbi:MAG: autotransporter domain-containing protein [Alphaproteobacteria bacterium]|nr:autotransporter domain-containing protein [Alphaproteobacteria bacterium]